MADKIAIPPKRPPLRRKPPVPKRRMAPFPKKPPVRPRRRLQRRRPIL